MSKIIFIILPILVSVAASVAGFLFSFNDLNEVSFLNARTDVIEAGVIWGIFIGLLSVPAIFKYHKVEVRTQHPVKIWLLLSLLALICLVINPMLFYLSQVA
ncbi:hypothetical protein [Motilimonas eburnea]|uniref:hypothetical protein n=1 Tax=Motilimonas eburnea TaxID=1737488 RepID=UPI001E4B90B2|nr:hypothetical protein [Motilimonas eburnea]MCE2571115.1 hypothetical protein [Motilimonas eburnea]